MCVQNSAAPSEGDLKGSSLRIIPSSSGVPPVVERFLVAGVQPQPSVAQRWAHGLGMLAFPRLTSVLIRQRFRQHAGTAEH